MAELNNDKNVERDRYDSRFANAFNEEDFKASFGADSIEVAFREPYLLYEKHIATLIQSHHRVLEIGSGSGLHTEALLRTGAYVTASDIAPSSLTLLCKCLFPIYGNKLTTQVADMESLPFEDNSFDLITCAGSLSYGDPVLVNNELARVLKTGGTLICVDSLNHNPVYRFNRFMQYLRKQRTMSTIQRMPTMQRVESIGDMFESSEINFFGAMSWAAPILKPLLGKTGAARFLNKLDKAMHVKRAAFKFVLVAKNKL